VSTRTPFGVFNNPSSFTGKFEAGDVVTMCVGISHIFEEGARVPEFASVSQLYDEPAFDELLIDKY